MLYWLSSFTSQPYFSARASKEACKSDCSRFTNVVQNKDFRNGAPHSDSTWEIELAKELDALTTGKKNRYKVWERNNRIRESTESPVGCWAQVPEIYCELRYLLGSYLHIQCNFYWQLILLACCETYCECVIAGDYVIIPQRSTLEETAYATSSQLAWQLTFGRTLHLYRRGHGAESRSGCVYSWDDQLTLHIFPRSSNISYFIYLHAFFTIYGYITNSQCHQFPIGLIAQLVQHCTGITRVMGSHPVPAWIFYFLLFFLQALISQLLKLCGNYVRRLVP